MSTDWVQTETLRHLHGEVSYCKVTPEAWYVSHRNVIDSRENLMSIYSRFIFPLIFARFFCVASIILSARLNSMRIPLLEDQSYITRPLSILMSLFKPRIRMTAYCP